MNHDEDLLMNALSLMSPAAIDALRIELDVPQSAQNFHHYVPSEFHQPPPMHNQAPYQNPFLEREQSWNQQAHAFNQPNMHSHNNAYQHPHHFEQFAREPTYQPTYQHASHRAPMNVPQGPQHGWQPQPQPQPQQQQQLQPQPFTSYRQPQVQHHQHHHNFNNGSYTNAPMPSHQMPHQSYHVSHQVPNQRQRVQQHSRHARPTFTGMVAVPVRKQEPQRNQPSQTIMPKERDAALDQSFSTPSRQVFIGNVAASVTTRDLEDAFGVFGEIESSKCYSHLRFAFVVYRDLDSAIRAKEACFFKAPTLYGRMVVVNYGKSVDAESEHPGSVSNSTGSDIDQASNSSSQPESPGVSVSAPTAWPQSMMDRSSSPSSTAPSTAPSSVSSKMSGNAFNFEPVPSQATAPNCNQIDVLAALRALLPALQSTRVHLTTPLTTDTTIDLDQLLSKLQLVQNQEQVSSS